MAPQVDKNNFDIDSTKETLPLHEYLTAKLQQDNFYKCDETAENSNADTVIDEVDTYQQTQFTQKRYGCPSNGKKRKVDTDNNGLDRLDQLASDRKPSCHHNNDLDEHDHFLCSLASELRKIDSKFTLHFRNEVHNLIIKYQSMSSK